MKSRHLLASLAVLVVLGAIFFAWRHNQRLESRLAGLGERVETLGVDVAEARERARAAEERADRAEERAEVAREEARTAGEQARESATEAKAAAAGRSEAEETARAAQAREEEARRLAEGEEEARRRAEAARQKAEKERRDADLARIAAEQDAERSARETEELREQRERERKRLMASLSQIAETRRTALGVVMNLDERQVEFDFDEAELRQQDKELLSRIAGVLLTFEDVSLEVVGHTDRIGSDAYNQELSERRAEAVRQYLVEVGLDPAMLSARGMGESSPLVEGQDEESRQRNRRVELAITLIEGSSVIGVPEEGDGAPADR